jgi:hypothetical protein
MSAHFFWCYMTATVDSAYVHNLTKKQRRKLQRTCIYYSKGDFSEFQWEMPIILSYYVLCHWQPSSWRGQQAWDRAWILAGYAFRENTSQSPGDAPTLPCGSPTIDQNATWLLFLSERHEWVGNLIAIVLCSRCQATGEGSCCHDNNGPCP